MRNGSLSRFAHFLFEVSWRAALVTLSWQTRWFRDASLGGWPWEQGRWSVYASMVVLVTTVISGLASCCAWDFVLRRCARIRQSVSKRTVLFFGLAALLFLLSLSMTVSFTATMQWWLEVLILGAFVATLILFGVDRRTMIVWFVIGMLLQSVLGIWQYFVGEVWSTKWFGIAAHLPYTLGTAVVEYGGARVLRAYAGFPHPNIFGGWLAVSILAGIQLAATACTKWRVLVWSMVSAVCSAALVVSYARGAWLALVVGAAVFILQVHGLRRLAQIESVDTDLKRGKILPRVFLQFLWIAVFFVVAIGGAVAYSQRVFIFSRASATQRLEVKSFNERRQSLVNGWEIFRRRPLFGVGPNAELRMLVPSCGSLPCAAPLEPPHAVFMLILADVGLVGVFLMMFVVYQIRRYVALDQVCFLVVLFVVSMFDHYPWSTWSGLCLTAIVFIFALRRRQMREGDSRV